MNLASRVSESKTDLWGQSLACWRRHMATWRLRKKREWWEKRLSMTIAKIKVTLLIWWLSLNTELICLFQTSTKLTWRIGTVSSPSATRIWSVDNKASSHLPTEIHWILIPCISEQGRMQSICSMQWSTLLILSIRSQERSIRETIVTWSMILSLKVANKQLRPSTTLAEWLTVSMASPLFVWWSRETLLERKPSLQWRSTWGPRVRIRTTLKRLKEQVVSRTRWG